jgi:hypothetical protein
MDALSSQPLSILGIGCTTAIGSTGAEILARVRAGIRPEPTDLEIPGQDGKCDVLRVSTGSALDREFPRLRRSSAISLFGCEAALRAFQSVPAADPRRTALIFAASNGAVIYTRKFFGDVVATGNGSPILFPETVYNSPASHIASLLGIDGEVITLVSDATAATDALRTASELIGAGAAENCLVVAAEEIDWVTWEAYHRWGLVRSRGSGRGVILSEGAVALMLGRPVSGLPTIARVHSGATYHRKFPLASALDKVLRDLCVGHNSKCVVTSASGARSDLAESRALDRILPGATRLAPKLIGGEAFSVSALIQSVVAAEAIRCGDAESVLVPVTGWNGHVGGLVLTAGTPRGYVD